MEGLRLSARAAEGGGAALRGVVAMGRSWRRPGTGPGSPLGRLLAPFLKRELHLAGEQVQAGLVRSLCAVRGTIAAPPLYFVDAAALQCLRGLDHTARRWLQPPLDCRLAPQQWHSTRAVFSRVRRTRRRLFLSAVWPR